MFTRRPRMAGIPAIVAAVATLTACSAPPAAVENNKAQATAGATGDFGVAATAGHNQSSTGAAASAALPGMPPLLDPNNIYAANRAGNVNPNGGLSPLPCVKIGGLGELAKNVGRISPGGLPRNSS